MTPLRPNGGHAMTTTIDDPSTTGSAYPAPIAALLPQARVGRQRRRCSIAQQAHG